MKALSNSLKIRCLICILAILVLGFGSVIYRLFDLQIIRGKELSQRASEQQLTNSVITAKRGTIYDSNKKVLAQSATVWDLFLAPYYFNEQDITDEEIEESRQYVARGLSEILNIEYDKIYQKCLKNNQYETVAKKIESDLRTEVLEFEEKVKKKYPELESVIFLNESYKRYYPYGDFAASVLGFTGYDGNGEWGVEYEYDEILSGTNGKLIMTLDNGKNNLPYDYENKVDPIDGNNLVLTLDETVQRICEKNLEEGIINNGVHDRAVAIMMNVKTGAIVAMAVEDGFDLNDERTLNQISKEQLNEYKLKLENGEIKPAKGDTIEDAINKKESALLSAMWRNKAVSDTYYPGSVFKIITTAMALEEGLVNENSSFYCNGVYHPVEGERGLHCHLRSGHGTQNLEQALCNSCNPAFMQIGQLIGRESFWKYYQLFGFSEKTMVDLPGESTDIFFSQDGSMALMDLAVASFGQNFSITPIQMVTAVSAVANGGKLMKPYIVQQVLDNDGNVISKTSPTERRQVISEDTARKLCDMLEENAISGAAKNGYVAGYRIAGKTGTSEKKFDSTGDGNDDYIASFCGFAPANDPEYALLVFFDAPTGANYYGSAVAAPVFANIMKEALPYLGIEAQYTEEELANLEKNVGQYIGLEIEKAQSQAKKDGFKVEVYGDGKSVISQIPEAGTSLSADGKLVLFTEAETTEHKVAVPNFVGYSIYDVNYLAAQNNLNINIVGNYNSGAMSYSQDIPEGTEVLPGTVVTIGFYETTLSD